MALNSTKCFRLEEFDCKTSSLLSLCCDSSLQNKSYIRVISYEAQEEFLSFPSDSDELPDF